MTPHEDGSERATPEVPQPDPDNGLLARMQRRFAYDPRFSNRKLLRAPTQALRNNMMAKNLYKMEISKSIDDPSNNLIVSEEERVELPALWVAELYSPSYAAGLTEALQSRSWPADSWATITGDKRGDRLRRAREVNAFSSGQIAEFVDLDSHTQGLFRDANRERLPEGIRRIVVRLETITPALTAVVATCFLDKNGKDRLDKALKAEYQPRVERPGGSIRIIRRRDEAVMSTLQERDRIHGEARRWLAGKVPGIFAAEGDGQLPVLDLLLTHGYDPIVDSGPENYGLRSALGVSRPTFGRTILSDAPGFRFDQYETAGEDVFRWTLCAKYSAAFPDERFENTWGQQRSAEAIASIMETKGWGRALLIRMAIGQLIDVKDRGMNRSRDLANQIHDGHAPVRSVKALRRTLLTNSLDLDAVAAGLAEFTSDRIRYGWDVPRLRYEPSDSNAESNEDVLSGMAARQAKSAKTLFEADRSMTSRLEVVASLTSAVSGIRTQRWAAGLSIVAIGIAAAAGYLAFLTLIATQAATGH